MGGVCERSLTHKLSIQLTSERAKKVSFSAWKGLMKFWQVR